MDYEGLVVAGSMVGSGGFMVMDETVDIFETTKNLTEFYKHESCGWCTPCREGTDWLVKIFKRIAAGDGRPEDAQLMLDICDNIEGKSFVHLVMPPRGRFRARSKIPGRFQSTYCRSSQSVKQQN
jgi:NADH-quinone oxidoreductase subunit F